MKPQKIGNMEKLIEKSTKFDRRIVPPKMAEVVVRAVMRADEQ